MSQDDVPEYLDQLFADGAVVLSENPFYADLEEDADEDDEEDVRPFECRLQVRHPGRLILPTGRIMPGDPELLRLAWPLAETVEPGEYPFRLSVAHIPEHEDVRIAASRIDFREGRVASWVPAPLENEQDGFGVDSGLALFVDAANDEFGSRIGEAFEAVDAELNSSDEPCPWGRWGPAGPEVFAVIAFPAGFGDGFYSSWWGMGEGGERLCLVTDFRVLGDW